MYEAFYGFTEKPFQLNPDPQFYFDSRQHRRAMAFVEYGLHQSEGFIVITGEVGAGKTTIVRNLLNNLNRNKVVAANLVSTQLDAEDTLRMVAAAFGIPVKDVSKSELLLSLEALLASHASQGRRCLLIVDEAQNLTQRAVEELRMLSNFQLGTHALLQSFLVGQPEFRHILQSPQMNQLRQRVIAACHIGPLDPDDTRHYVEHRLRRVGWKDNPPIPDDAHKEVHAASGGVPRRINLICDRVLLSGFLTGTRNFSAQAVKQIAEEVNGETFAPSPLQRRISDPDSKLFAPIPKPQREEPELVDGHDPSERGAEGAPVAVIDKDKEMRDLKAALLRVERGNLATLGMFRRFVDWMRVQEQDKSGHD
jgi:general secretion pathway protein A